MKSKQSLNTTDEELSSLEEVTEQEEKKILSSLRSEAYQFVPDKLLSILKECGICTEISPADEKLVLDSFKLDEASFQKDALLEIKKETGTYVPELDKETQKTQKRIRKEGRRIVPDVERAVMAESGIKRRNRKPLFFGIGGGVLGLAAAATAVVLVINFANNASSTTGTASYISFTVTPASYSASKNVASYYSITDENSAPINRNTPTWNFLSDKDNIVSKSHFRTGNYSASLITESITDDVAAPSLVKSLLKSCYSAGYLETRSASQYNNVNIQVFTTDPNYKSNYYESYFNSVDEALKETLVYANFAITVTDMSSEYSGLSTDMVGKINNLYFNFDEKVNIDTLKQLSEPIIDSLNELLANYNRAKLTPRAEHALKDALRMSLEAYLNKVEIPYTEEEAAALKESIIAKAGSLPWVNEGNLEKVSASLENDAYYMIGDKIAGFDDDGVFELFADYRNYVIAKNTVNEETYLSLLGDLNELAKSAREMTGIFADGYNNEKPDQGPESHIGQRGDGPKEEGWGHGGIHEGEMPPDGPYGDDSGHPDGEPPSSKPSDSPEPK
ncbi:MAG: hypothetical protein K5694_05335 [Bacilli bacterium]|nr:hypothetical protein [Bacilli bacterium]